MTATMPATGSAEHWGPLWGARPRDWAVNEEQQRPTYEEAIRQVGIGPGRRVLEVGCGTGVFLRAVADRGAEVSGLDASKGLLELARERVPEADLRHGDMQFLPYEDDTFDLVAGFNSFFFAADMVAALREAGRVAKPGAPVVIQVWGRPERCAIGAVKRTMANFLPPPPDPDAPSGTALWQPGALEALASEPGLTPATTYDVSWAYEYANDEDLVRAMVAAGGLSVLVGPERQGELGAALLEALAPYKTPAGGYILENESHVVVATA